MNFGWKFSGNLIDFRPENALAIANVAQGGTPISPNWRLLSFQMHFIAKTDHKLTKWAKFDQIYSKASIHLKMFYLFNLISACIFELVKVVKDLKHNRNISKCLLFLKFVKIGALGWIRKVWSLQIFKEIPSLPFGEIGVPPLKEQKICFNPCKLS